MKERSCDGCAKCCEGWLAGEAYGHAFFRGRPCFFLNKTCSIYDNRPAEPCKSFKCGWLASPEFPEWMKPDLSNVIINRSKSKDKDIDYFILVEAGSILSVKVLSWMIQWTLNNNQNLLYYIDGGMNRIGSKEFLELQL